MQRDAREYDVTVVSWKTSLRNLTPPGASLASALSVNYHVGLSLLGMVRDVTWRLWGC